MEATRVQKSLGCFSGNVISRALAGPLGVGTGKGLWSVLVAALCVALLGCSRAYYRRQADVEVTDRVLADPANPGEGPLADFTIDTDPRSRMHDPWSPDYPPMPPDDPTSHLLMQEVDNKRGSPVWDCYGTTGQVEGPYWRQYLPADERGVMVLDRSGAVSTALVHSSDYQSQLEELYLSALDVTFERFRFDTNFFGGSSVFYTASGPLRSGRPSGSSVLDVGVFPRSNRLRFERLFAAGGELVVGFANQFVWEFAGPNEQSVFSLLDFSFTQPLLQRAGRARVLERLTLSERALLANVRQMEQFRRGFYVETVTGRSAGQGPQRRGGFFGAAGLEGFTGVGGGGFGRIGTVAGGVGGGGAGVAGGAGAASAGGFVGLLQDLQEIRNQEANVAGLRDSVAQLEAVHEAGRIDRYQVDLARQALYNAESILLRSKAVYQSQLDDYKVELGLPPDLEVRIEDPLLKRFELLDPALGQLQKETDAALAQFRQQRQRAAGQALADADWNSAVGAAEDLSRRAIAQAESVSADYRQLQSALPARRRTLERLRGRAEAQGGDVDADALDAEDLDWRVRALGQDIGQVSRRLVELQAKVATIAASGGPPDIEREGELLEQLRLLSDGLFELSLLEARARLDAVVIEPVDMTPERALEIARTYRRDWMNARANLVDIWRLIEFNATDLKSGLDVTFSGDVANVGRNPLRLDSSTGQLRVGLAFDSPLTRIAERNIYRQSLIEYQQARRQYYRFRDRVNQQLRLTLRNMQLDELNFELRRQAVFVAIAQVDLSRLRLLRPPQPGETTQLGETTARDLVTALSDLLNVQNDFLSVWVDYEVQRMGLDFDLGTMQLDEQGMWIDPGAAIGQVDTEADLWEPPAVPDGGGTPEEIPALPAEETEARVKATLPTSS